MRKPQTKWEGGGGTYCNGTCDVVGCENSPNWRNWDKDPLGMNGDDKLLASVCNEHEEYKSYQTTDQIIKATTIKSE